MGRRSGGIKNGGAVWRIEKGENEKECNEWIGIKEWEKYFREVLGGVDTRRSRKNDLGGERERERQREREREREGGWRGEREERGERCGEERGERCGKNGN